MLCYLLAERSVLRETMPSGCTQDLRQNTDRPKPVNYILFFFLLKFEIFWEILLQAPPKRAIDCKTKLTKLYNMTFNSSNYYHN